MKKYLIVTYSMTTNEGVTFYNRKQEMEADSVPKDKQDIKEIESFLKAYHEVKEVTINSWEVVTK